MKKWVMFLLFLTITLSGIWSLWKEERELVRASQEVIQTEALSEIVSEVQSEMQTEIQTEAATEAQTVFPMETEQPGEVLTEVLTEALTEAATERTTEAVTEVLTEVLTERSTEAVTETATEMVLESETMALTEQIIETETRCNCGHAGEDPFFHCWDCLIFEEELKRYCNCMATSGSVQDHRFTCKAPGMLFRSLCSENCRAYEKPAILHENCACLQKLREFLCDCGNLKETFADHVENCNYRNYMSHCEAFCNSQISFLLLYDLPASGNSVTSAGSGFIKAPSVLTSTEFCPVKFYPGISSVQRFTSANVATGKTSTGRTYMYPKNGQAKGTFGVRYRKVLYYNHAWYDMKMTVQDYSEKTYVNGGGTTVSRPFIVFYEDRIGWGFNERMGELILKTEFVKTGTNTPAPVNARFQWWDIDSAQRFGIRLSNGSFAARYYSASGSAVNYQNGKVASDQGNYLICVGQGAGMSDTDVRGHLTFELSKCSTYYIAFAYQDHIKDSDNYRNYKTSISKWNTMLAAGEVFGNGKGESVGELIQTDTSLSVIDTPAPKKYVSNTVSGWKASNTVTDKTQPFYYMLECFVPWNDTSRRYSNFQIRDVLPKGVDATADIRIVRVEDNVTVTDRFQISTADDIITLTATDAFKNASNSYGYHYRMLMKVNLDLTEMTPQEEGSSLQYRAVNQAELTYQNLGVSSVKKKTNQTVTSLTLERSVRVFVTKKNAQTQEVIPDAEFHIYEWDGTAYGKDRGMMNWNAEKQQYTMEKLERTLVNQGRYQIKETKTPIGYKGSWEQEFLVPETDGVVDLYYSAQNEMVMGQIRIWKKNEKGESLEGAVYEIYAKEEIHSPQGKLLVKAGEMIQVLTTAVDGKIRSQKLYPGSYVIREKKAPSGYALDTTEKEIKISAQADPGQETVEVCFVNRYATAVIVLKKELDAERIVWAHGNPTFTFCLTGKDIFGMSRTYYETVEFTPEVCSGQGKVSLSARFPVLLGEYTALELETGRYALQDIHSIIGGERRGDQVVFSILEEGEKQAVFYNRKVTDQDTSHTFFVRNHFGTQKK